MVLHWVNPITLRKSLAVLTLQTVKSLQLPMTSVKLQKFEGHRREQLRYSQIIGSLMYLTSVTRPNISYAVSKLSRFTSNPWDDHWKALERVCRYLIGTSDYEIHYSGYPHVLEGCSDSNWISDADEIKATSGYIFNLAGAVVAWRSCKRTVLTKINDWSRICSTRDCH